MNVDARLQLTMSQKLVMTPMLQQAIRLLQMSRIELVETVKQELLENPVLDEIEDMDEPLPQSSNGRNQKDLEDSSRTDQAEPSLEVIGLEKRQHQQESAVNWEDYFTDNPIGLGYYGERNLGEQDQPYENLISHNQSLSEHLAWQLQMSNVPERTMKIGTFLIGQIDDDGYIQTDESDLSPSPDFHFSSEERRVYRAQVIDTLCHKLNAEFEREYLLTALADSENRNILAMLLVQEYYDDLSKKHYKALSKKLHYLAIEELEAIAKFLLDLSASDLEKLTTVPASEIGAGLLSIHRICRDLRQLIEQHLTRLLKEKYDAKIEKTGLSIEEFYLVEYLLLHLSAEEVAYVASKENSAKAAKRENDVQIFLEKLRQSYAHVEQLQSHKYFLIQLYRIGIGILIENFKILCPPRYHKLFLKLLQITQQDIEDAAAYVSSLVTKYHEGATPVSSEEIVHTLSHIQTFAPPGVGARDLQECLNIQANNLGLIDTAIEPIIDGYLKELQQQQYERIAEALHIPVDEVELVAKIIINMSPKPGSDFSSQSPEYIVPDIYVYKVSDDYEVVLNEDELPYLRINPLYKKLIMEDTRDVPQGTRQYVDQKLRSAIWFIRSVEQRKRTIYKVGRSIVKFQQEFLEHGVTHLKPLVLRDVADDISMHESTVSRVTTNKYIHTPQGVFELKFFFHSGLESSSGNDVSSIAVKERIKQLITEEDRARPLSDKAIEDLLKEEGVAIARRTVAKYREELNIPSSLHRKCA